MRSGYGDDGLINATPLGDDVLAFPYIMSGPDRTCQTVRRVMAGTLHTVTLSSLNLALSKRMT